MTGRWVQFSQGVHGAKVSSAIFITYICWLFYYFIGNPPCTSFSVIHSTINTCHVFRHFTVFVGVQWWANSHDSCLSQHLRGWVVYLVVWKNIRLPKKDNSLPSPLLPRWFVGRPTGFMESLSALGSLVRRPNMKGNLESLRILRDSAFLGEVGGNFIPHPCPPAVRRMRVTLGGHCSWRRENGWGWRAGKSWSSCWSQISADGLESGIPLCAGIQ